MNKGYHATFSLPLPGLAAAAGLPRQTSWALQSVKPTDTAEAGARSIPSGSCCSGLGPRHTRCCLGRTNPWWRPSNCAHPNGHPKPSWQKPKPPNTKSHTDQSSLLTDVEDPPAGPEAGDVSAAVPAVDRLRSKPE